MRCCRDLWCCVTFFNQPGIFFLEILLSIFYEMVVSLFLLSLCVLFNDHKNVASFPKIMLSGQYQSEINLIRWSYLQVNTWEIQLRKKMFSTCTCQTWMITAVIHATTGKSYWGGLEISIECPDFSRRLIYYSPLRFCCNKRTSNIIEASL